MISNPRLRPFGTTRVWTPTGEESAALDRYAAEEVGVPEPTLMENAGRSAALLLDRLHPRGRVVGLVGSGNNGGDALVVLRTLAAWGRPVTGVLVSDRPADDPLFHGWDVPLVRDGELRGDEGAWDRALAEAGVLVDGILGTGIRGAPRERQAEAIRALNRSGAPVLSLDIPSGVDAATGAVPGEAVKAVETVAFGWPKLGSLFQPGRDLVGRLLAVEIAFPPPGEDRFPAELVTPAWAHARRPRRPSETHKKAVGTLVVVAGSPGMAGAATLAARGASRAGAGLVRVASSPENREILQKTVPEAIFVDASDESALAGALGEATAVVAGPGIGTDDRAAELLERILDAGRAPVLLDADALTLLGAGRSRSLDEVGETRPVLVTPHPGEMARIHPAEKERIVAERAAVAREAAASLGVAVLLKGLPSVVARPDGHLLVDAVGTSDLATAGMGDVLSGAAGAFLCQGAAPGVAGALALHYTGRAGVRAARGAGLIPDDVAHHLPDALAEEGPGATDLDFPFLVFDQDPAR